MYTSKGANSNLEMLFSKWTYFYFKYQKNSYIRELVKLVASDLAYLIQVLTKFEDENLEHEKVNDILIMEQAIIIPLMMRKLLGIHIFCNHRLNTKFIKLLM